MKVKDFMIQDVITVSPTDTIRHVMQTFVDKRVGGVPIVDNDNKLAGMVSDGDILRAIKPMEREIYDYFTFFMYIEKQDLDSFLKEVGNVEVLKIAKRKGIVKVTPEDGIELVLKLMSKHHFKKLPVVDSDDHVVGVISRGDVIRSIQKDIMEAFAEVN